MIRNDQRFVTVLVSFFILLLLTNVCNNTLFKLRDTSLSSQLSSAGQALN